MIENNVSFIYSFVYSKLKISRDYAWNITRRLQKYFADALCSIFLSKNIDQKALYYVSDYQLKSACKHAICIAPSKIIQMIFAVLVDWYHHIVLTDSCKLVSFFYIYDYKADEQRRRMS